MAVSMIRHYFGSSHSPQPIITLRLRMCRSLWDPNKLYLHSKGAIVRHPAVASRRSQPKDQKEHRSGCELALHSRYLLSEANSIRGQESPSLIAFAVHLWTRRAAPVDTTPRRRTTLQRQTHKHGTH